MVAPTKAPPSPEKYDAILTAALQVFAAKGFHESKISEIARVAGVADGTIYLYFKSKDDILISLFEEQLVSIIRGMQGAVAAHDDPRDKLRAAIDYQMRLAVQKPQVTQLITVELRRSSTFMKDYGKEQFLEYLKVFEEILRRGKERGVFGAHVKTGMLTQIMFGALDYCCVTWVSNPNRKSEDLEEVGRFFYELLVRSIAA